MLSVFRLALVVVALGLVPFTLAEDGQEAREAQQARPGGIAQIMRQAGAAFESGDVDAWVRHTERLHELRPYSQDFMRHLVLGYSRQGEITKAFNMMLLMQQQGLSENWDDYEELEVLRPHRLYEHMDTLMREAGQPFGRTREVARLEGVSMPEALAFDPASNRLFVGTVRSGRILVRDRDGDDDWAVFARPSDHEDLMAVMGMAVDSPRNQLVVATGAARQFRGFRQQDAGRTAILRFDLESGELISRHRLIPDGRARLLGTVAVASDGTVFAADSTTTSIFRLGPEDASPQRFFGSPNLTSLRGLVLSADDALLYVADYDLGVFVIDTQDPNNAWKLAVPENLNEGGIDGLYRWENHLVAIQNNVTPQRILRLELGEDGLGVVGIAPVAAALEQFDTPTFGYMDGSRLVFLAGSHWQYVDARGRARDQLPPVAILSADVDSPEVMVVGREVLEQLRRRAGEN